MRLGIIRGYSEEDFAYVAGKGLKFIELTLNSEPQEKFEAAAESIKALVKKYGVDIGSVGRWGLTRLNPDGSVNAETMDIDKRTITTAAAVGCKIYNLGVNKPANRMPFEDRVAAAVAYLTEMVEFGKSKGVQVNVYNCDWGNFICQHDVWKHVLPKVPGLGIKYDPTHTMGRHGDPYREIKEYGKYIKHFHIKGIIFVDGREYDDPPAGLDQINWGAIMAMLYSVDYNGGLSIEPHSHRWTGARGDWGIDYTIKHISPMIMLE
jgi:sugar phosphate isomerase/epimerase